MEKEKYETPRIIVAVNDTNVLKAECTEPTPVFAPPGCAEGEASL